MKETEFQQADKMSWELDLTMFLWFSNTSD